MFRSTKNSQQNIFSSINTHLSSRKQDLLADPNAWHNVFYREFLCNLDEQKFAPLYHGNMGRPNASVRELVGMIVLKEGQGWSDSQLFEQCRFNIKVMMALGKANLDEDIPVEATYYDFKRLLSDYNDAHNCDLLKEAFQDVTIKQLKTHELRGSKIRMDSKLINSNIRRCHRVDVITEAFRKFTMDLDINELEVVLDAEVCEIVRELKEGSSTNLLYKLTSAEKKELLTTLGRAIRLLLNHYRQSRPAHYEILERIYREQYEEKEDEDPGNSDKDLPGREVDVQPRDAKDVSSSSVQSMYDPTATFQAKGTSSGRKTARGYHVNVTETCDDEDDIRLITDLQVGTANKCEGDFMFPAIEESESILENAYGIKEEDQRYIDQVITDGGYDKIKNREEMMKSGSPQWKISKMKGIRTIYEMKWGEDGELEVWEKASGKQCQVGYSERAEKYVITKPDGQKRYLTKEAVEIYITKSIIESHADKKSRHLRANAESTIHQMFHRLGKASKIKYRGLFACQTYVVSRAIWVNIQRIIGKMEKYAEKSIYLPQIILRSIMKAMVAERKKLLTCLIDFRFSHFQL